MIPREPQAGVWDHWAMHIPEHTYVYGHTYTRHEQAHTHYTTTFVASSSWNQGLPSSERLVHGAAVSIPGDICMASPTSLWWGGACSLRRIPGWDSPSIGVSRVLSGLLNTSPGLGLAGQAAAVPTSQPPRKGPGALCCPLWPAVLLQQWRDAFLGQKGKHYCCSVARQTSRWL